MKNRPRENTKPISDWLKSQGAFVVNLHGGIFLVGLPDLVACWRGRFVAIEVKRPNGKATKLQQMTLRKIAQAGGIALVANSVKDVETHLSHYADQRTATT